MANIGRICDQQQSIFGNKGISIYGILWKRVKNGDRHKKKRKSGESNRVCEKNETDAERGRSSIKEGIGRYEEASR